MNDDRGYFLESYSTKEFENNGINCKFVQDNHSFSKKVGTIRGLHFQKYPFSQAKLIRVIQGKILDIVVDLRKDSLTYGQWRSFELSSDNFSILFIPEGFAHGFCTLENNVQVEYKVSAFYNKESESGIIWNDPDLNILWPIINPVISEKDAILPQFKEI